MNQDKHIEAAAAAIKGIKVFRPTPEDMAQAAYNAIIESLASAGEDGVVEAMREVHSEYEDHKHGMRAALAVARLSMGEVERDAAWCIENYIGSILHYWTGDTKRPWSDDNLKALRFARRTDAERMLTWHCDCIGRVAEHMWVDAARAKEAASNE